MPWVFAAADSVALCTAEGLGFLKNQYDDGGYDDDDVGDDGGVVDDDVGVDDDDSEEDLFWKY